MTIDHTLSWEVARVGGMLAYVLATASVVIGMLVSLKLRSTRWPRFVTTEVHRFVTVLALIFTAVHGVAVWIDPFTGFSPAEVLVPLASHYRPLWIAFGIVSGYLLVSVWASEYVRRWIGYAWWRRFHYLAFGVLALGTLHGIGSGSDTAGPWALAIYAICTTAVLGLLGWRILGGGESAARSVSVVVIGAAVAALALFTAIGPAQAGWNAIANDGNGDGASDAWLAAHPAAPAAPGAFSAELTASLSQTQLSGTFSGGSAGSFDLQLEDGAVLSLRLTDGWSCSGIASGDHGRIFAECAGSDASTVRVILSDLRRADGERVVGEIRVDPTG